MFQDHFIRQNLLPYDGALFYVPNFLNHVISDKMFEVFLKDILWEHDEFTMFGKKIISKRKVAWYGAKQYDYTYSGIHRKANLWTPELLELKKMIEDVSHDTFNTCLLNLYHNGLEGMGWHSDDEKELEPCATIASVSLGSDRKFSFRHKESKETLSLTLQNGSLLLMKGEIQNYWQHQLPKTKRIENPRINFTFRSIIEKS